MYYSVLINIDDEETVHPHFIQLKYLEISQLCFNWWQQHTHTVTITLYTLNIMYIMQDDVCAHVFSYRVRANPLHTYPKGWKVTFFLFFLRTVVLLSPGYVWWLIQNTHTEYLKFWRASNFVLQSLCHMLMPTRVIFPNLLSVAKRKRRWWRVKERKGRWVGRKRKRGGGELSVRKQTMSIVMCVCVRACVRVASFHCG